MFVTYGDVMPESKSDLKMFKFSKKKKEAILSKKLLLDNY